MRRGVNNLPNNSFTLRQDNYFDQLSQSSIGNSNEMEEDCVLAGDYVDVHGRPVEVLQAENGQLFVNLDDVRAAGFSIYKKESYENASISNEVELRNFENFLLNQGRKYVLDLKKTFNETEMLGVLERVTKKIQSKPIPEFGEKRMIKNSPNSKNFTIVKSVTSPSTSFTPQTSRSPKQLADNIRPSFSYQQAKTKRDFNYGEYQDNQRHGSSSTANGFTRSPNTYQSRNNRNQDTNQSIEMRKPKFGNNGIPSKVWANKNVNQEPEESWEGKKTFVTKPKLQYDSPLQQNNERNLLNVNKIELSPNALYKIKVSYINPNKKNVIYAQWIENLNQIEQILLHVNTIDNQLPIIQSPTKNDMCVAKFEECWYRAVVLKDSFSGPALVQLIDYGNRENINESLREISEEMRNIPAMGIKVAIHGATETESNINLEIEQYLEVFLKKLYDDKTHLVEIKRILDEPKLEEESLTPPSEISSDQEIQRKPKQNDRAAKKDDCFMEVPPSTGRLSDGEDVIVVGYTNRKFILRNKESALNCKKMYTHILNIDKKPVTKPIVGQLVLCSRDGMMGLHRAAIKQINNEVANLEYLDYNEEVTLSLKSLRNVDKLLASYPSAKIESPEVKYLQDITEKIEEFLSELIINKTKLKVILNDSNFDLQLVENEKTIPLSKKIEQLKNPVKTPVKTEPMKQEAEQVKETLVQTTPEKQEESSDNAAGTSMSQSSPLNDEYVTIGYDEMEFVQTKKGEDKYICYCCKGDSVTLLSTSDAEKYIPDLQIEEPIDTNQYEPELFQMCLSKFDEIWYRAIVLDTVDNMCEVLFVDFGNEEKVPKTDIKPFPKKLSTIPILGIPAYFLGIPEDPKVYNRLKELIPDEEELIVNLKTDLNEENSKYGIEIPSIYEVLKNENLI